MIAISLLALIKTLANHKCQYVIEIAKNFDSDNVLKFIVSNGYPSGGENITVGDSVECDACTKERNEQKDGKIMLIYDTVNMKVISACNKWYNLLKEEKRKSKNKVS